MCTLSPSELRDFLVLLVEVSAEPMSFRTSCISVSAFAPPSDSSSLCAAAVACDDVTGVSSDSHLCTVGISQILGIGRGLFGVPRALDRVVRTGSGEDSGEEEEWSGTLGCVAVFACEEAGGVRVVSVCAGRDVCVVSDWEGRGVCVVFVWEGGGVCGSVLEGMSVCVVSVWEGTGVSTRNMFDAGTMVCRVCSSAE